MKQFNLHELVILSTTGDGLGIVMATRQGLNIRDVGKQIHATIRIVELMFTSSALQLQM